MARQDGAASEIIISTNKDISKPLTSNSYKVLLAIFVYINENNIDPFNEINISLREIVKILNNNWGGGRASKFICQELTALNTSILCWSNSFNKGKKINTTIADFSIFDSVIFSGHTSITEAQPFNKIKSVKIKLNKFLSENIKNNNTIPINYEIYKSLEKKTYSQIIYLKICLILSLCVFFLSNINSCYHYSNLFNYAFYSITNNNALHQQSKIMKIIFIKIDIR